MPAVPVSLDTVTVARDQREKEGMERARALLARVEVVRMVESCILRGGGS